MAMMTLAESKYPAIDHAKEVDPVKKRSPKWPAVREKWLDEHPKCAVCGTSRGIQVHHIFPFNFCIQLGRRDLELDTRNFMTLCESEKGIKLQNHHCLVGHLDFWQSYNNPITIRRQASHLFKNMTANAIKKNVKWLAERTLRPKPFPKWTKEEKKEFKLLMKTILPKL